MNALRLTSDFGPILKPSIVIDFDNTAVHRIATFLLGPRDPVPRFGLFLDAVVFRKRLPAYVYERVERDISTQPMRPAPLKPPALFSMYMMRFMLRLFSINV
jgi:hypothetical protein